MEVIFCRNVHEALPFALQLLDQQGQLRDSRNGKVLIGPSVTTVYERPWERVMFWPARDANPFFHLYESLWMLAGRNDVGGPARYAKQIREYSDDGKTLHGAYGRRWREQFYIPLRHSGDQLGVIADRLKKNPDDRRCILQMWDCDVDLDNPGKDVPCNVMATFQRGLQGELNLTVFCRSNDIVWGAYGANAVHFSFLLEYMALWIGCPMGTYTQVSVNWHGYLNTLDKVKQIRPDRVNFIDNPYTDRRVHHTLMEGPIKRVDDIIHHLLEAADNDYRYYSGDDYGQTVFYDSWGQIAHLMLKAHSLYRKGNDYAAALEVLKQGDQQNDWIVAGTQWMQRRLDAHIAKSKLLAGDLEHP